MKTKKLVFLNPVLQKSLPFFLCFFFALFANSCKTTKENNNFKAAAKINHNQEVAVKEFFINACRQKSLGNFELAIDQFKECLKLDTRNSAAQYELATIYSNSQLFEEGLSYSKSAALAEPKNEWFQLLYIECLHNKKMYNESASVNEKLISLYPEKIDYYLQLANEYLFASNEKKALSTYDLISNKFGITPEISLAKIKILRKQKKNSEAEAELKKLIDKYPNESDFHTYLADLYQETKQPEKAMEVYKRLLKSDGGNPHVHLALADFYRNQNNDSAFLREVSIAFKNDSLSIDIKIKILISFYTLSQNYPEYQKEALNLAEILINIHPNNPRAHSVYGDFLYQGKKIKEARNEYVEALKYEKSKFAIWNQVLIIDSELRDIKSLDSHSSEAIELFPSQPIPLYFKGAAQIQLKNYDAAIDFLLQAKEFVIDNNGLLTQIFSSLGDVYNLLKKFEESDKAFESALSLETENTNIMNNFSYYLSLRKSKLEQAEKLAGRANELEKKNANYMDTYAWILFQSDKFNLAKEWLEKAIKTGGEKNGIILEHYGDVLFKLNEVEKALEYWKKSKASGRSSEKIDKKIADKNIYEE